MFRKILLLPVFISLSLVSCSGETSNQDVGTKYPHQAKHDKLDKFEHSRSVPFQPNSMFCTVNSKDSWHQAPVITEGIRKSLMLRYKI